MSTEMKGSSSRLGAAFHDDRIVSDYDFGMTKRRTLLEHGSFDILRRVIRHQVGICCSSRVMRGLANTLTQFMVHFVDGRGADAGLPGTAPWKMGDRVYFLSLIGKENKGVDAVEPASSNSPPDCCLMGSIP